MTLKDQENRIRLFALAVVATAMIIIMVFQSKAHGQGLRNETGKEYHDKLQKSHSWENYQSNRLKSAKARAKAKRKHKGYIRSQERLHARIRRIEG
jgi:hypothetical protein